MKEHKRWDFSIFIAIAATEFRQPGVPWTTEMCDHRMTTENMSLLREGMAVINLFRSNERSLWPYFNTSQMHHYRRRELYETSPGEGLVVKNLRHKDNSTIGFVKGEKLMNSWLVNHSLTWTVQWKLTFSHIMTKTGCPLLNTAEGGGHSMATR